MPRHQRCRRICGFPVCKSFTPENCEAVNTVTLTLDEYEVARLVDYEKQTHEQCAAQMDISRTTVTEIYETARYKIADSIVNGKRLLISGGNYRLCDGTDTGCCKKRCERRQECRAHCAWPEEEKRMNMKVVAVSYENGEVFQHFGHTEQFKISEIENGTVVNSGVVSAIGSGHGALAEYLKDYHVDTLLCGGIGGGAQTALAQAGIELFGGIKGNADEAVNAWIAGSLMYDPEIHCDHHDHEGHGCGEHVCGEHNCEEHDCEGHDHEENDCGEHHGEAHQCGGGCGGNGCGCH